jgi:MFS family permease
LSNRNRSHLTRRSLRASLAEGMVAELVGACSNGAVLTAWALHLGLSAAVVAALATLPACAQLVQLPAAQLTTRAGSRRVAIWAVSISRQVLLPLCLLPLLGLPRAAEQRVLFCVAGVSAVLGVIGNNAWTAWMGDLVPARIRGRYFGRRAAVCTFGSTLASLAVGLALDAGRRGGATPAALAALSAVACAAGALTTWLLLRQHEPAAPPAAAPRAPSATPPLGTGARQVLAYQLAWSAAGGIAAGFYNVHALTHLKLGFLGLALYNAGIAASRMVAAPLWGRAIDRFGARPALVLCSAGLALPPILWTFISPDALWPLAIDAAVCGSLMAGQSLAAFALPLSMAPREERPFHLAAFCTGGGVATLVATVSGVLWLKALPPTWSLFGGARLAFHALFLASAAGRIGAALLGARIQEPGARPASALLSSLRLPRWMRARAEAQPGPAAG